MREKLKDLSPLVVITLIPTFLVWLPFFLNLESIWSIPLPQEGMTTIASNFDGPLYIAVAKSFYNTEFIRLNYSFPIPLEYYAAHFPLFPLLIRLFTFITNYPYSMLFVTLISSFLSIYYFKKLISDYVNKKDVLWITLIFSIFPARWLIVRSIGSPEPLFLTGIIASLYYFKNKKYLMAGLWGVVAQLTKSPGILIFIAYGLALFFPAFKKSALTSLDKIFKNLKLSQTLPILLIPLSLLVVFYLYQIKFGNFFAYFNSGDNIHLFFPPFQIFNYAQPWVNTFWLEEIIFIYLFGILGLLKLIEKKEHEIAWFVGIFFATILFVSHRDLIRYSLPIVPFHCIFHPLLGFFVAVFREFLF